MRYAALAAVLGGACGVEAPEEWQAPVLVADLDGDDPTLTGDLLELYFEHASQDIYVMTRATADGAFSTPRPVGELNGASWDATPEVTPDGLAILFASDRAGDLDLWMATRPDRGSAWSAPMPIPELASADLEFSASMSADRLAIVFTRLSGGRDLYASTRATATSTWQAPVLLAELVTPGDESEPHLAADGRSLVFASTGDLQETQRESRTGPFAPPAPLSINTPGEETDPWMAEDQRTVFFMRDGMLWTSRR